MNSCRFGTMNSAISFTIVLLCAGNFGVADMHKNLLHAAMRNRMRNTGFFGDLAQGLSGSMLSPGMSMGGAAGYPGMSMGGNAAYPGTSMGGNAGYPGMYGSSLQGYSAYPPQAPVQQPMVAVAPVAPAAPPEPSPAVTPSLSPEETVPPQAEEASPTPSLSAAALEQELQASIAMQKNALTTMNGQVAELSRELKDRKAVDKEEKEQAEEEGDPNAIHMTIKYPGAETAAKEEETPAPATEEEEIKEIKTPLLIIAPKPLLNFDKILDKATAEAEMAGSTANREANASNELYANPEERIKILYDQLKSAQSHEAFFRADLGEMETINRKKPKGILGHVKAGFGNVKAKFHKLLH